MAVPVTCKNKEDQLKNEGARVLTTFLLLKVYGDLFRHSRAANSVVRGWIWFSLLPARMKKIQLKLKRIEWPQEYTLIFSDAQGQLTP